MSTLHSKPCGPDEDDDDLDRILNAVWRDLTIGADNPAHDFHWPVLATVAPPAAQQTHGDAPMADARTVVLRHADASAATLDMHTDTSAAKCDQLRFQPVAMLTAYDRQGRTQLRLRGLVTQHVGDELAQHAWQVISTATRNQYTGYAAFCVLRLRVNSIDWLSLLSTPHRRARFERNDAGLALFSGRFIAP